MHDCPCCGDDVVYSDDPNELCRDCREAGCEPDEDDYPGIFSDCQVRILACPECDTPPSFMNDGHWHDNCDEDCERVKREGHKTWPGKAEAAKANTYGKEVRDDG